MGSNLSNGSKEVENSKSTMEPKQTNRTKDSEILNESNKWMHETYGVIWNEPKVVPESVIQYVDEAVLAVLPTGTKTLSITPHGSSYFNHTALLRCLSLSGDPISYFFKATQGPTGYAILDAEYRGMSTIHSFLPSIAPRPLAVGTYTSPTHAKDSTYFYLCSFIEMIPPPHVPSVAILPKKLAELHHVSVSPTGKFGFDGRCFMGKFERPTQWTDSWEEAFRLDLKSLLDEERKSQGIDDEMEGLRKELMSKVVPRLLRPLQEGGRSIVPRLVHSDLWDGNCAERADKEGEMVVFDASAWFAHNEFDLGPWMCPRHIVKREYVDEYFKHFPPSEPVEDLEDRLLLYMLRFDTVSSASYPGNLRFRKLMIETMKNLVDKYPGGYEDQASQQEPMKEDGV